MLLQLNISESLIGTVLLSSLVSALIAWIIFHFYSTRRFEKKFKGMGIERNDWDPFIVRSFAYSLIIIYRPKRLNDQNYTLVPVSATRKLATRTDKILAIWLWISAVTMILVGLLS